MLYLTITELAKESKTSEASVTRLCRNLGCKGYTEFKMALALDVQKISLSSLKGETALTLWSKSLFRPSGIPVNLLIVLCWSRLVLLCTMHRQFTFTVSRPAPSRGLPAL
ncbi:MurR/RpiR family transcriptional regulator [Enterobacter hormaechei]|uniref:MurR/RpiR family transcriptional regulator n=1 Tax=Enterobacter hormaechei TaxID=158836 RepID=UPI00406861D3